MLELQSLPIYAFVSAEIEAPTRLETNIDVKESHGADVQIDAVSSLGLSAVLQ